MRTRRWVSAVPAEILEVPRLYVRLEPFQKFLRGWLNRHDWDLEGLAEQYVLRFGGSLAPRTVARWLVSDGDRLVNLYLVDEVMTMLGHHPIEVYGDEWWSPSSANGGRQ